MSKTYFEQIPVRVVKAIAVSVWDDEVSNDKDVPIPARGAVPSSETRSTRMNGTAKKTIKKARKAKEAAR